MTPKLLLVGGGKMGSALLTGLLAAEWAPIGDLVVSETDAVQRARLEEAHPGLTVVGGPVEAEDVLLAVKPDVAEPVLLTLAANGARRVLSIVAGISSARLEAVMPPGSVVVRAMPNTPSLVGAGVAGLSGGMAATAADLDWAEGILGAVGTVVRLPERQLDAVTGVSGSGPAYMFLVAEAMIEAGVTAGLSRDVSHKLVVGTMLGAARMMDETGEDPSQLRAASRSSSCTCTAAFGRRGRPAIWSSWTWPMMTMSDLSNSAPMRFDTSIVSNAARVSLPATTT